jgi:Tfp pilus assembly protein PilF
VLGGVGVALGVFTDVGQRLLRGGASPAVEQQLMSARKLLGDDTLGAYRKAAQALQPLYEQDAKASEILALAAQARLAQARLGVSAELRNADGLLAKIGDDKAQQLPEVQKARGLRALVAGQQADARAKLNVVLQRAPADATALVYLGWTELAAGDSAAADRAFGKALAAEGTRAQALYGAALAKERLGDGAGARDLFQRALARSPSHFGAAVGVARTSKPAAEAQAEVQKLIETRTSTAAPRELAEGWATLGSAADKQGRHDEAEDRLKRALGLDPELASARVALARVECELGRPNEALLVLGKLLATQPRNLDARLVLGRAQLETGDLAAASSSLGAAAAQAPQSPEVLYWQGRLLLAQPKPGASGEAAGSGKIDREGALAKLKEAIAADPKLIAAYVTESTTLAALGRDDEALAALQAAEKQASDDPELTHDLGQAYLALGKPAEAEKRFRAALAAKPDARGFRLALAGALEAEGKLDEAKAEYTRLQKEDAKYPGVTERLARLALKEGHKAEAAQLFDAALKEGVPPA